MKIVLFCHSLLADWNHGNAHFLRGIVRELLARGHRVRCHEPAQGWSRRNQLAEPGGRRAMERVAAGFPPGTVVADPPEGPDLDRSLDGADLVLVHEWTDPGLVTAIGERRVRGGRFTLLFHDTHHRAVTRSDALAAADLSAYDGVLAFGAALAERYRKLGWGRRVRVWHEAADVSRFRPAAPPERPVDLVWIGNWGDGERTSELGEFLVDPSRELGLSTVVHGVRYPPEAMAALRGAGISHRGWIANDQVPTAFAGARLTVHIPRRPYVEALPGIPTIRVFEALACGIPLISAPWDDQEQLFGPEDFRHVRDGSEMRRALNELLRDRDAAEAQAARGLSTVLTRHTCAHRVDELLAYVAAIAGVAETRRPLEVG